MSLPNFPLSQIVATIHKHISDCQGLTVEEALFCLSLGVGCDRPRPVDMTRVSPESLRHVIGEPLPAEQAPEQQPEWIDEPITFRG